MERGEGRRDWRLAATATAGIDVAGKCCISGQNTTHSKRKYVTVPGFTQKTKERPSSKESHQLTASASLTSLLLDLSFWNFWTGPGHCSRQLTDSMGAGSCPSSCASAPWI